MLRIGTSTCTQWAATPPTPRPPTSAPTGSTSGGRAAAAWAVQTAGAGAGRTATTGSCTWGRGAPGPRYTPTCSAHTGECFAYLLSVAVEVFCTYSVVFRSLFHNIRLLIVFICLYAVLIVFILLHVT